MKYSKEFIGETPGTFTLVLFGCGSVAVSILFGAYQGLMQIALAWGIGGIIASVFFINILEPAMKSSSVQCHCTKDSSIEK